MTTKSLSEAHFYVTTQFVAYTPRGTIHFTMRGRHAPPIDHARCDADKKAACMEVFWGDIDHEEHGRKTLPSCCHLFGSNGRLDHENQYPRIGGPESLPFAVHYAPLEIFNLAINPIRDVSEDIKARLLVLLYSIFEHDFFRPPSINPWMYLESAVYTFKVPDGAFTATTKQLVADTSTEPDTGTRVTESDRDGLPDPKNTET